jgi:hypothetical protein
LLLGSSCVCIYRDFAAGSSPLALACVYRSSVKTSQVGNSGARTESMKETARNSKTDGVCPCAGSSSGRRINAGTLTRPLCRVRVRARCTLEQVWCRPSFDSCVVIAWLRAHLLLRRCLS